MDITFEYRRITNSFSLVSSASENSVCHCALSIVKSNSLYNFSLLVHRSLEPHHRIMLKYDLILRERERELASESLSRLIRGKRKILNLNEPNRNSGTKVALWAYGKRRSVPASSLFLVSDGNTTICASVWVKLLIFA